ncbi:MAG: hypothetical protein Q4B14_03435, partial [Clostridia bacterium]|nr:hypothetical protein [Clostridia bacterium]
MKKKVLSIFLSLCLIFSSLPFALAEENPTEPEAQALVDETHDHTTGWTAVTEESNFANIPTDSESKYYLDSDTVTLNSTLVISSGIVNLCLNGFELSLAEGVEGSVIKVESGATLNLYDCQGETDTPGTITGGNGTFITKGEGEDEKTEIYGGGILVEGTLNMHGGKITENTAENGGGGVYVEKGAKFTMTGGTITDNEATGDYSEGGGVYVYYGTFTMSNGTISGNKASGEYSKGGGVYVQRGTFTMTGGEISSNEAKTGGGAKFNGHGCKFTMSGGKISGNKAAHGGGVRSSGTFTMSGDATISGNTARDGGGVCVGSSIFTMNGGTISGNKASGEYSKGGGVYVGFGTFTMNGGTITGNTADDQGDGVITYSLGQPTKFEMTGGTVQVDAGSESDSSPTLTINKSEAGGTAKIILENQGKTGVGLKEGDSIAVTLVPNSGYRAGTLSVKQVIGEEQTDVEVTDNTFKMPSENVTISATFSKIPVPPAPEATYKLSYNSNGGSGEMETEEYSGGTVGLSECTFTAPEGKEFAGWSRTSNGDIL